MKQINLNNFKVITDNLNTYFKNNKIISGSSVPTGGSYSKGDIIVNNGANADKEPMWICVESGNPGKWEVVGAGGTDLVHLKNNVIVNNAVSEVSIGIDGFNPEGDVLTVYRNSVYMIEGVDYNVQGNKIVSLKGNWNAENQSDYKFTFEVLKAVDKVNPNAVVGMENLKDDVRNAIEAAGNIDLSGYQGKTDNSLATTNKTIVGAINELFQSANNGKQLIASAIGEPLSSNDTFSAMSNDINGLLSTFKTNMMKNGVTVGSSDRFKQLIDKIATLADNEGKGIQYAEGVSAKHLINNNPNAPETISVKMVGGSIALYQYITIDNLNFTPSIVIAMGESPGSVNTTNPAISVLSYDHFSNTQTVKISSYSTSTISSATSNIIANDSIIFDNMIKLPIFNGNVSTYHWYAIGVGEEDTTLRDSLASILQEEGVSVTEEDDMASLIGKVDEEFNDKENEAENVRNTLAGLMQEGGYDITGEEDINSLLDLLVLSGINITDIKQIACGMHHTFILKNDGSVWACGDNEFGQLGMGGDRSTFTQVTININNDVKQIVCGEYHTFILKKDGSIWACGHNGNGQLGLNSTSNQNKFNQVTININNDVKQIACGNFHTVILKNDGSVWSCGYNTYGQLGLGNTTTQKTFTQVTTNINNDVKQIVCGASHTFILKKDGSIWACGYNNNGQLGLNSTSNQNKFNQVTTNINNDVKQIVCGYDHTFILKNDGSVWSCGLNDKGQLGLGDNTKRTTFTQVTTNINNDVKQIVCGASHTFILKNDGSVWSCGYNHFGQLGLGTSDAHNTFTKVTTNINNDVKQIAACGEYYTFLLKNDGSVWACGLNAKGQLGLGTSGTSNYKTTFTMIPRGLY